MKLVTLPVLAVLCLRAAIGAAVAQSTPSAVQITPYVATAPHAAGTSIGGLMSFTTSRAGVLQSVTTTFASGVEPSIDVVLFNDDPSSSTIADGTLVSIAAVDLPKIAGVVHVRDCTLLGRSSPSVCQAQQQAMPVPADDTLYATVITRTAVTLTGNSDMTFSVNLLH